MNKERIRQVIIDHRETYLEQSYIPRHQELEPQGNYCFVGIRRTGKSFLMLQQIHDRLDLGLSLSQVVYLNFEDERLLEMTTEDLNTILEIALESTGTEKKPQLFLDEIQNVTGWEKFVRRLADMKYPISITGSNSRMLSREIASTLGGRLLIRQVYPYTFQEYLKANGETNFLPEALGTKKRARIQVLYADYVTFGAFPELVNIHSKQNYLHTIYQTIYLGDILARNKITNDFALRLILKKIAESAMRPLSFSRLTNILKSTGAAIGKQTVINYVGYVMDSYLLFPVCNYAAKLVEKESNPKYYFMDTGLLGLFLLDKAAAQLENLAAVELCRRYGVENIFYYGGKVEVDFYIPQASLAIQVSYQILTDLDTYRRETNALVRLKKLLPETRCLILTNSEEKEAEEEGVPISIVPMWKWLLREEV